MTISVNTEKGEPTMKKKHKIKAVYPVKSKSLCEKCSVEPCSYRKCQYCSNWYGLGERPAKCYCEPSKVGQPCKYFIRKKEKVEKGDEQNEK